MDPIGSTAQQATKKVGHGLLRLWPAGFVAAAHPVQGKLKEAVHGWAQLQELPQPSVLGGPRRSGIAKQVQLATTQSRKGHASWAQLVWLSPQARTGDGRIRRARCAMGPDGAVVGVRAGTPGLAEVPNLGQVRLGANGSTTGGLFRRCFLQWKNITVLIGSHAVSYLPTTTRGLGSTGFACM